MWYRSTSYSICIDNSYRFGNDHIYGCLSMNLISAFITFVVIFTQMVLKVMCVWGIYAWFYFDTNNFFPFFISNLLNLPILVALKVVNFENVKRCQNVLDFPCKCRFFVFELNWLAICSLKWTFKCKIAGFSQYSKRQECREIQRKPWCCIWSEKNNMHAYVSHADFVSEPCTNHSEWCYIVKLSNIFVCLCLWITNWVK